MVALGLAFALLLASTSNGFTSALPAPHVAAPNSTCSANWTAGLDVDCCNIAQSGPHTQEE
jgi:hypothetical protein